MPPTNQPQTPMPPQTPPTPSYQPQPPNGQPAAQPMPPYGPPNQYYAPQPIDPGKGLGIAGLVMAFILPVVGFILSIISRNKSVKAGYPGGLGLAGIITSSVLALLWLLFFIIVTVAYLGMIERANEASSKALQREMSEQQSVEETYSEPNEASVPDPLAGTVADQNLQNDIIRDLMIAHAVQTGDQEATIESITSSFVAEGHYIEKWTVKSSGQLTTYIVELRLVPGGVDYTISK